MATASDIYGDVFRDNTAFLMARAQNNDATLITQAAVDTIFYTIYLLDDEDADSRDPVANHTGKSVTVADVIFDTLQTDARWTKDDIGYNFGHQLDISTNNAFAIAGRNYLVEYKLKPDSGQVVMIRFRMASK